MRVAGCEFRVAGCGMRGASFGVRVAGCEMRDAGCGVRAAYIGYRFLPMKLVSDCPIRSEVAGVRCWECSYYWGVEATEFR